MSNQDKIVTYQVPMKVSDMEKLKEKTRQQFSKDALQVAVDKYMEE